MDDSIFQSAQYLDFHTHRMRNTDDPETMEIVSLHPGKEHPHQYFTIGYHPWWIEAPITNTQQEQLSIRLSDFNCLALGEIGLDNLKGPEMKQQMAILRSQLPLAIEFDQPVIIHCVRAFDQLIKIKKEFPEIDRWCIHGYGRHAILAKQLIDQGFYLSLMPGLPRSKYAELFQNLPIDRLFLETDSMPNISIKQVYSEMSELLSMKESDLCNQMNDNAQNFFKR